MPVLSFTPADALQTIVIEAGGYTAEIVKIDGPKQSSSGKSVNFFVDIQILGGKYKGKVLTIILNSETKNYNLLGTQQFYPQSHFLQIDAAINKSKIEAVNRNLDTDDLLHKPFDISVAVTTIDGNLHNIITGFLPQGAASSQSPF